MMNLTRKEFIEKLARAVAAYDGMGAYESQSPQGQSIAKERAADMEKFLMAVGLEVVPARPWTEVTPPKEEA